MPEDTLRIFDYLWGMDFESSTRPIHVKLRIDPFSTNLVEKIKNDTSRRKHARLYRDKDYWFYEDDIIGINSFRSWINQYGYSVIALEPESLARDIYDSACKRFENYKRNHF